MSPLTGLPGTAALSRALGARLRGGRPFVLGWADLDDFKPFNDRYGFSRGDEALRLLGEILERHLQHSSGEMVSHIGGDDFAFLIEDDDLVAKRFNAKIKENLNLHPLRLSDTSAIKHDLFQYMIGNLDWSTTFLHNSKIMLQPTNRYIPLAYDFDMSGYVNPPYGVPNQELGQEDIRDRIYRGFCRQEPVVQAVRQHYLTVQPDVMAALAAYEKDFPPRSYTTLKQYVEGFYAMA